MTSSNLRRYMLAVAAVATLLIQLTFTAGVQSAEIQEPWQSVVLRSVGEGWSIDQGLAEASLSNGKFSATIRQVNPRTKVAYDLISLTGTLSTDKSLPKLQGVSGYAVTVTVQYKNSDRDPFEMSGTYRRVALGKGSYDEVLILHEDYNVITMSRRIGAKK